MLTRVAPTVRTIHSGASAPAAGLLRPQRPRRAPSLCVRPLTTALAPPSPIGARAGALECGPAASYPNFLGRRVPVAHGVARTASASARHYIIPFVSEAVWSRFRVPAGEFVPNRVCGGFSNFDVWRSSRLRMRSRFVSRVCDQAFLFFIAVQLGVLISSGCASA